MLVQSCHKLFSSAQHLGLNPVRCCTIWPQSSKALRHTFNIAEKRKCSSLLTHVTKIPLQIRACSPAVLTKTPNNFQLATQSSSTDNPFMFLFHKRLFIAMKSFNCKVDKLKQKDFRPLEAHMVSVDLVNYFRSFSHCQQRFCAFCRSSHWACLKNILTNTCQKSQ